MAHSVFLTPCFVNNDCVRAEIISITAHAHHMLLCAVGIWGLHLKAAAFNPVSWLCPLCQSWEQRMYCVYCYSCCTGQKRMICLEFPWFFKISSSPLACTLYCSTVRYSNTIGIMNRISNASYPTHSLNSYCIPDTVQ